MAQENGEARAAFLDGFEKVLQEGLLKVCDGFGLTAGELMETGDVSGKWDEYIKEYVGDAVENFNAYPDAALAWAAFLGMGVAAMWDRDWEKGSRMSYKDYYGPAGWDDMDEHVLHDLMYLNLSKNEAAKIRECLLSCSTATLELIRHEGIEPQTPTGFYVLVRAYGVFFRLGETIVLRRLGYKKVMM